MKTGITGLIGLAAVILSALGQDSSLQIIKTNAAGGVPGSATAGTNTVVAEWSVGLALSDATIGEPPGVVEGGTNTIVGVWSVEFAKTNATELAVERESMETGEANRISPTLSRRLLRPEEAFDEIETDQATYKGPVVVFLKKQNPLAVFNPFRPARPGEEEERPLWDPYLGGPRGIVLFGVHR